MARPGDRQYLQNAYAVSLELLKNKFKTWKDHFLTKTYLVDNPDFFHKIVERLSKKECHDAYDAYLEQIDTQPNFNTDKAIINQYLSEITESDPLRCQFEQLKQQIITLERCYCLYPSLTTTLEKFYNGLCDNLGESVYRALND
ncbi:hypothetical protein [unidentified bacterial endosymbiont]|uniref:hypothetical protein n=1 Tax=unidentified bacterial endosymbiont TaxID=2355 RepID=UPI00209CE797|nr:hypothetical protein [unidentified bacterial endosymbiont]